jgi:hypothetical protein
MNKELLYKVIQSVSISELENKVNEHLEDGWLLAGGVNVLTGFRGLTGNMWYTQAIYKNK